VREVVEEMYPQTQKIVLVMDNINTHSPASLYQAFTPVQAKRITDKLEIHYTPKPRCIGNSPPPTPVSSSAGSIHQSKRDGAQRWRAVFHASRLKMVWCQTDIAGIVILGVMVPTAANRHGIAT